MQKIQIFNGSNDHKYFTQVPNIILDTCDSVSLSLYIHIKRIAGDNGKCEAGADYFLKKLRIGRKSYKKALDFLIERRYILFLGKSPVSTGGGIQQVNVYSVVDVWEQNLFFYNPRGVQKNIPFCQGGAKSAKRGVQKDIQGVSKRDNKEDIIQEEFKEGNFKKNIDSKIPQYKSIDDIRQELVKKGVLSH